MKPGDDPDDAARTPEALARHRLEARLDEKRRRLELALEAGRLGPWDWDIRAGTVTWSPAVEAMHGIPIGSFGGTFEAYQRDLHPDDRERVLAQIARTVEERREHEIEYRIVRPDGQVRWIRAHGRFVLDDSGAPIRLVGVCSDVTEQRQEATRREFMAAAIATLGASLDYRATLASVARAAVADLVDGCAIDLLGADGALERVAIAPVDHPLDLDGTVKAGVLATGRPVLASEHELGSFLVVPLRIGGRTVGAISMVSSRGRRPLDDHDLQLAEELSHAAASAVDNARLYEAEQRARARAEAAVQRREDLLAIVSHDLRNPLGTILTAATLLERAPGVGEPGTRSRKSIDAITRAAHRMNRLIADLLDLSSLERAQLRIEPMVHDAAAIVDETVQSLGSLAAEKTLRLTVAAPPAAVHVRVDRERMIQVLSNLVGNSIKFTPEGGAVTLSLERDGGFVRVAVADTGIGIDEAQLPYVFDRYWRAGSGGRAGVGLGLSIVKGLVEAHGGSVAVRSRCGEGTTVEFTVPAADSPLP